MATTRVQTKPSQQANAAPTRRKPGPKPGTEAAKRGGNAAKQKYGREFYSKIGAIGGSTVRERHGSEFYTEIGRRGGETTKRTLGSEHYSRIGRIGGKRAHGPHRSKADKSEK
jgi:general stress protein YciG